VTFAQRQAEAATLIRYRRTYAYGRQDIHAELNDSGGGTFEPWSRRQHRAESARATHGRER